MSDLTSLATRSAAPGGSPLAKTGHALDVTVLSKRFGALPVLEDVGFSVAPGEFLSIVGASGCGKSTLLRLILGLDTDYEGDIRVGGVSVEKPGIDRAIVFQEHRLLPWLTVERNVAVALRSLRLGAGAQRKKVHDLLRLVGLSRAAFRRHGAARRHRPRAGQ
jgi:sulfonate transport system ATP-binding protein